MQAEPIEAGSSQFVSAASLRLRLDWLNRLRWGAALVVLSSVLVAGHWLGLVLPTLGLLLTAGGLCLLNLLYVIRNRRWPPTEIRSEIRFVKVQMVGDLLILTELLNLTGGLENPFFFIYIIHVILASLLFKGREIFQIAALAVMLFTVEVLGEKIGFLPHHHLLGSESVTHDWPFVLAGLGAFWLVMLTCAYLGASIMRHNRAIKDELVERQAGLMQADAEKMEFFRFVTHEVKSPVSTAQSAVQAVLELEKDGLSEPVRGLLERGVKRLEQANRMVRDLADLTRGGQLRQAEASVVDLGGTVARIAEGFAELARERGVEIVVAVPEKPVIVQINAAMFDKVASNLIGNGVRYSNDGGRVKVTVRADGDRFFMVVKDHGIGIPREDQERVFEEFFRTQRAREISRLGSGLGLAIVQRFVMAMDGTIELESEVGVGSTFSVNLPLMPPAVKLPETMETSG